MQQRHYKQIFQLGRWAGVGIVAAVLAACGGGGGSPGAVGGSAGTSTGSTGSTDSTGSTGNGATVVTAEPELKVALLDGNGKPITSLSGGQAATVKALVKTANGAPASGMIVQFQAGTADLIEFTPATGSALTDASGVAVVSVKPASFTASGAVAVTATSVVASRTATATINIAVGAAPLTVGTLAFVPVPSGRLPAFSTLSLKIPVTSGGQPVSSVSGLNMTSECVGDGTATLVPGAFANGVQFATYTNNGCLRGRDLLTVSIGNSVQTIGVEVDPANIGSIRFTGSNLSGSSIVLKGSGGLGRSETAKLTFKVVDQHDTGLAGVDVNFSATTTTGGLSVTPNRATTDANGDVTAMVSSGTIPTPVRVIAEATRNGTQISGLSDALTVSTGLPIQKSMSISAERYNIEGGNYDNTTAAITVLMADQYGNPVSDNTAINFVTEGGAIGSSAQGGCVTTNGGCSVTMRSQEFRPINGRVTVLAYAQGIEDFVDKNGDGQYSCSDFVDSNGVVPPTYRPLVDTCADDAGEPYTDMGDPFLDTGVNTVVTGVPAVSGTLDGVYESAKGDLPFPYGHTGYSSSGNGKWGLNYIRRSIEMVFSGSQAFLTRQVCSNSGCRDWTTNDGDASKIIGVAGPSCGPQQLVFRLTDANNNPMPEGTTIATDTNKLSTSPVAPGRIPSTNAIGGTLHSVTVKPDANCASGGITVQVTTPKGNATSFTLNSN